MDRIYNAYHIFVAGAGGFWEGYCQGRSEATGKPLTPMTRELQERAPTSPWYMGRLIVRLMH